MEHVVFFPGPDGSPSFRRFTSLDEAVRFVEHLRNVEGVAEVSLHALTPVPVSFRAYYRVEVPTDHALADQTLAPEPTPAVEPTPAAEPTPVFEPMVVTDPVAVAEPTPVAEQVLAPADAEAPEQSPNGKRSLGFFAR